MDSDASWMREKIMSRPSEWTHERTSASSAPTASSASKVEREKNKRIRTILADEGIAYGKDTTGSELAKHLAEACRLRENSLRAVMINIKKARNADLCFLVDITGSMQSHVDEVRKSIETIVSRLTETTSVLRSFAANQKVVNQLRFSFVGYRDHSDADRFSILDFTESVATFRSSVTNIRASGGGDTPEDVFGGLDKALNLSWSGNAGTRIIFHIADAPCHGTEFHNSDMGDAYPRGDPKGLTHTGLFKRLRDQGIDYYFGTITPHTKTMIEKFSDVYGEKILDFDLKAVDKINESVFKAVSISVSTAIEKSTMIDSKARTTRAHSIVKEVPNWDSVGKLEGTFISYGFPESIDHLIDDVPLPRKSPKKATLQIATHPFANGSERLAYYARSTDRQGQADIVVKEYIHVGMGMNSPARYESSNQLQTIASYLAREFSKELNKKGVNLKFLKIKTLSVPLGSTTKLRFMSSERRYVLSEIADRFVRFTNNVDYVIEMEKAASYGIDADYVLLLLAFSHWTYQKTKKNMMVVDLQGIITKKDSGEDEILLTDPAIHCIDPLRYGKMNLGAGGMNSFFGTHKCNKYCQQLLLEPVKAEK